MKLEDDSKPGNGSHRRVHRSKHGGEAPSDGPGTAPHGTPEDKPNPSLAELGQLALARLEALGDALQTLWAVRKDKAQLALRQQVVRGTAAGFGRLFDGKSWLGDIAAGVLYLVLVGGGLAFALWRSDRRQFVKQREKYEEIHRKRLHRAKTAAK
jgi:hypothetical protein